MGLGANILAQPGGQPIFQTIGRAGIDPLKTLICTKRIWSMETNKKIN